MTTPRTVTDQQILTALVAHDDQLPEREQEAFTSMQTQLTKSHYLTTRQREWAEGWYRKLELDADEVLNLASSGRVKVVKPTIQTVAEVLGPHVPPARQKPLHPPGRRCYEQDCALCGRAKEA